jgi:Acyl-CoA carboxylase epsilon subunit
MSMAISVPDEASAVPVIAVTRGEPTRAELAAVLAVLLPVLLAARSAAPGGPAGDRTPASRWAEHSRARTAFPRPGPHAWRASALPH